MLATVRIARSVPTGRWAAGLAGAVSPANFLTVVRLPLAALLWLHPDSARWLTTILVIGAASDVVDGRVARAIRARNPSRYSDQDARMGAWLDPLCDKLFAVSALGALWYGFSAPLALIALALTREILVAPLTVLYLAIPVVRETLRFDFRADRVGKLTTTSQFAVAATLVFVPRASWPLAVATSALGVFAAVHYVWRGIRAARVAATQPAWQPPGSDPRVHPHDRTST